LQHLEEEEEEAEPPEKPLIKNQQLLSSPNRKTSSNQHQMEPLSRKFTILSKIGEGGYGNVYTVKKTGEHEKDSNQIYALKTIRKDRLKRKPKDIEYAQNERYIMASFNHPFIVHLQYAFQSNHELYYVMEYVPGGEIFTRLGRVGTFTETDAKFYTAEILMALDFLHAHNIIYRDLKPDNILIERDGHIKLADFGLCKVLSRDRSILNGGEQEAKDKGLSQSVTSTLFFSSCSDTSPDEAETDPLTPSNCHIDGYHAANVKRQYMSVKRGSQAGEVENTQQRPTGPGCTTTRSCCGTLVYMAPEVVDKQAYGRSADFWSLGVVVYDMLVGHTPFHVEKTSRRGHHGGRRATVHGALPLGGHHSLRPKTDRNATRYNILHCNYRLPNDLTSEAKSFIEGLLQLDVNRRMGGFAANADPIKAHPFLADIDWDDVQAKRMVPPFVPQIEGHEDVSHFDTNWTSDVTEVGKVIDASLFDHHPIKPVGGAGKPVGAGGATSSTGPDQPGTEGETDDDVDELHLSNFEFVSSELTTPSLDNNGQHEDQQQFVME